MSEFEVIVGNIGTVYHGTNRMEAHINYNRAVGRSKRNEGRGGNEPVTLMCDSEPVKEHFPPQTDC